MNDLKKVYLNIKLSDQEIDKSWQDLKTKIDYTPKMPYFRYGAAFLTLMILFLAGLVGLAQAAGPATPLFPVKVLSDKITGKVLNKPEIPVEKRAQDLIEASDPKKIEAAKGEYNKALDEAQKEAEKSEDKSKRLGNSLEKQEELFKKEIKENAKAEEKLKKLLEKTSNIKEKIREDRKKAN